MKKLLRFLGFENEDEKRRRLRKKRPIAEDDEDEGEYEDERNPAHIHEEAGLIYFKGLATDDDKLQLRDALLDGCIVILDLSGITLEQKETGLQFITFMSGVAFANRGEFQKLAPTLFSVSPRQGMVQKVVGASND